MTNNKTVRPDDCPYCGSPAFAQWFNEKACFVACSKDELHGTDSCPLASAQITKWMVFDNESESIAYWNRICQEIRTGKLCPECQGTILLEELEKDIFFCHRCHTLTRKGRLLPQEEAEALVKKHGIKIPSWAELNCDKQSVKKEKEEKNA